MSINRRTYHCACVEWRNAVGPKIRTHLTLRLPQIQVKIKSKFDFIQIYSNSIISTKPRRTTRLMRHGKLPLVLRLLHHHRRRIAATRYCAQSKLWILNNLVAAESVVVRCATLNTFSTFRLSQREINWIHFLRISVAKVFRRDSGTIRHLCARAIKCTCQLFQRRFFVCGTRNVQNQIRRKMINQRASNEKLI